MKKKELADQIKKFMYDYKFKDDEIGTNVISVCYLKSLLSKAYSNNSKINPYSIISGDFNKLNDLNLQYGFREGDRCIKKAINLISEVLPQNALICRYGGDEFIFILPDITDQSIVDKYMSAIQTVLSENSKELHSLSISLASGNSYEGDSLNEVYAIVDERVSSEKLNSKGEDNFYQAFSTLYNSLRMSQDFKFTTAEIKKLILIAIDATHEMLKTYKKTGKVMDEETELYKNLSDTYQPEDSRCLMLTDEEAIELNKLFIGNESLTEEQLEDIPGKHLEVIAKDLVVAYEPMAFSRDYYSYYLQENLPDDKMYRVVLLSLSGLKLSNLIFGHNRTDQYLHEVVYKNTVENIDRKRGISEDLCTDLFNPHGKIYKIAIGGADILYIEDADSRYRPKDEWYRTNDDEGLLRYVKVSVTHPIKKQEIMDWVSYAGVNSKPRKDKMKEELFESKYAIELAKVCLKSSLEMYCREHPTDYMESNNVKEYIIKHCEEMFRFKRVLESETKKTSFIPNDIHFDYSYNDANEENPFERDDE